MLSKKIVICLIFCFLILGCTETKNYLDTRTIYNNEESLIEIDIYSRGIDNYQLDFFYISNEPKKKEFIQSVFLNDARYISDNVNFEVLRINKTIKIYCNIVLLYPRNKIILNDLLFIFDQK